MPNPHAKRIIAFHKLGKNIIKADQKSPQRADGKHIGVAKRFSERYGIGRDQVEKARVFALLFNDEEVEGVCNLGSDGRGRYLTKSHVIRLVAVRNKRSRMSLARIASQQGWTVQRLGQEIKRRGNGKRTGRRPKRPATVEEALEQIQRMAQQWKNWMVMMEDSSCEGAVTLSALPDDTVAAITSVARKLQALHTAIQTSNTPPVSSAAAKGRR